VLRPRYLNMRGSLSGRIRGGSERGKRVVICKVEGSLVARWGGVS